MKMMRLRRAVTVNPISRISTIAGQFKGMIEDLETAVNECAAEKEASRERVQARREAFDRFEAVELGKQVDFNEAIETAEDLAEGLANLMKGGDGRGQG